MKHVVPDLKGGSADVLQVPIPKLKGGHLLISNKYSLISAGTERMILDFAEKNLLEKARSRPDLVRQTLDKAAREGVLATYEAVNNRLEQPLPLGYSCAGIVIEIGRGVEGFDIGDRVACAGGGYAVHAEVIAVPKNLVVKLPDDVDFESAAFTTLAAIALQGVRLADPKLGEVVAVIGLGLLGQLTVQMLKAAGCIVVGMDILADRAELAKTFGADAVTTSNEELDSLCRRFSNGHGADSVLITADTKSNQPIEVAGQISRRKGHVVAVGAVGMNIPRKVFYEKEVAFSISSSYGPGRYDSEYEEKGHDYPYAYVRWTENRNMQAFVNMVARGQVDVKPLITHRYPIDEATAAYELITGKLEQPFLGVLLTYPDQPDLSRIVVLNEAAYTRSLNGFRPNPPHQKLDQLRLGVLGAGLFANATLLPAIKDNDRIKLVGIASGRGVSARVTGDRFGFDYCTTDSNELLSDTRINTVAILTRHSLHARQVIAGLKTGKHVFVEKPLCLTPAELQQIVETYHEAQTNTLSPKLMVGFNRRFAPFIIELKQHLQKIREPLSLHYRVNAGFIPVDHWTQDPEQGGGRLLGEGVHFIDLILHLAKSNPIKVMTSAMPDMGRYCKDNFVITIHFADGSLGTVTYMANGDKSFSKEMLEVFGGGLAAQMEDYRQLTIRHNKIRINRTARLRQDKGHRAAWEQWSKFLIGSGLEPIAFDKLVQSMDVTFAAQMSMQNEMPVSLLESK